MVHPVKSAGTLLLIVLAACGKPAPDPPRIALVEQSHMTMGSELRLTAYTPDEPRARAAFAAAFREVDRLDSIMSVWKPGSEILQVNAAAGDHAVKVGPEMREILTIAAQDEFVTPSHRFEAVEV